jgi:ketol-acid reductoisomerase
MAYNYAPTARAHGATTGTIINSFTFALVPPIASKTIVLVGCVCSSLEVTFDKATEGGRGHFSATFETAYNHFRTITGHPKHGRLWLNIQILARVQRG